MKVFLSLLLFFSLQSVFANPGQGGHSTGKPDGSVDLEKEKDIKEIEEALTSSGVGGWVHASVDEQLNLVFTWRRSGPYGFFINYQFPMTSEDPFVLNDLLALNRHDRVKITGKFIQNKAPLRHIAVDSVTMLEKYTGPSHDAKYEYTPLEEVYNKTEMIAKVHIVVNGGSVLVVEKEDRVLPVFNSRPELTRDLFRNDKLKLHYVVRKEPNRPTHLEVDPNHPNPVQVLQRIEEGHGKPFELTGSLVMFPKSPQIRFDIFAIREPDPDNIQRNYTLVNFTDMALFEEIRRRLGEAWQDQIKSARYDRNKFINPKIRVTAKGMKNVVAADQANAQILIDKIEDLKIEILP